MSLEWEQVVVAAKDPVALGQWWADVLGWVVLNDSQAEFEIRPAADRLPGLVFVPVQEAKESKNRLHLDFRADVGQGASAWVVLADPEGNEFCVLSARRS